MMDSRGSAPRVTLMASGVPGWQRVMVREINGASVFDGLVPDEDLAQEVSVIVGRYWRMVLEERLSKEPSDA